MKILFVGDSLVGNYSIAPEKSWSQLLKERYLGKIDIDAIPLNGATSSDVIGLALRRANRYSHIVFLMGSNDAFQSRSLDDIVSANITLKNSLISMNISPIIIIPPGINMEMVSDFFGEDLMKAFKVESTLKNFRQEILKKIDDALVIDFRSYREDFKGQVYTDGLHFTREFHEYLCDRVDKDFLIKLL